MKKEWDKAIKMLKEAAGTRGSNVKAEVWPTGMSDIEYSNTRYTAYIEDIGMSDKFKTPTEAVKAIIEKMSEFV